MLTEEKMDEVEASNRDQDPCSFLEAPVPKFENALTWADIAVKRLWMPYMTTSQSTDDRFLYQGQVFNSKEDVVHAIKTFYIRSHQQYYVYKSSHTLLKLKCKRESECAWSLRLQSVREMDYGKLRNIKAPTLALTL